MKLRSVLSACLVFLLSFSCDKAAPPPGPVSKPATSASSSPSAAPSPVIAKPATLAPATAVPGTQAAGATPSELEKTGAVVKTPSGLEYTVLKDGVGDTPALGSLVKVHVVGTRASDKVEFMNTRNPGGVPNEYKLDSLSLVKGWVETLTAMRAGEKRKVHMPHGLAYGVRGLGDIVPPRADVDFEIELVSFTKPGGK